jgi:hypothetical protein
MGPLGSDIVTASQANWWKSTPMPIPLPRAVISAREGGKPEGKLRFDGTNVTAISWV